MGSTYEVHVVAIEKLGDDIDAECEGDAAIVLAPALHVLVWIAPKEIAEQTGIGYIGGSHDAAYLFHGL